MKDCLLEDVSRLGGQVALLEELLKEEKRKHRNDQREHNAQRNDLSMKIKRIREELENTQRRVINLRDDLVAKTRKIADLQEIIDQNEYK